MTEIATAPARTGRTLAILVGGLLIVTTVTIASLNHQAPSASPPPFVDGSPADVQGVAPPPGVPTASSFSQIARRDDAGPTSTPGGKISVADGLLPDAVTVFDDQYPGIANLDPDLARALQSATQDAGRHGIELDINSGWRSARYQNQLLRQAVARYGSAKEAARWVATADTSPHVSGDAVDIGPSKAVAWLSDHGVRYGLCQIYGNEPWHFELRPAAIDGGCPPLYADPTHDPRIQR